MAMPRTLLLALLLLASVDAAAEIAVIVNGASPVTGLTAAQVTDLYLGRSRTFPGGEYAQVFDQERDAPLRGRFFAALTRMTLQQVNAYWARLTFTGQVLPPQSLSGDRVVLDIVRRNVGAIGYVDAAALSPDASVRVVLRLPQ